MSTLLSLGHGYSARALARRLVAQGWTVIGTTRNPTKAEAFRAEVLARARAWAEGSDLPARLQAKQQQRRQDEARKPLAAYREEELARMRRNFYGFDPSYHIARSNFVHRVAPSWTPRHLAVHRDRAATNAAPAPRQVDGDQASACE